MSKHEELIQTAKQKFPEAPTAASALGMLSLEIFEQIGNCKDISGPEYMELRDKYFDARAAYDHEFYKMTQDSNFIKMEQDFGYGQ